MSIDKKYNSSDFIHKLKENTDGHSLPCCRYCGGSDYTTPAEMATIFVANNFNGLQIGPTVPCAMVICKKCGHVDFFAIGILGLLPEDGAKSKEVTGGK